MLPLFLSITQTVGGHADQAAQASAGHGLHPLGHVFHAEQKNAQAANQAEDHVPQKFLTHNCPLCLPSRIQKSCHLRHPTQSSN